MKLKIIAALFAVTLVAGLALAPPSTAFADPKDGSPASCAGFEADAVPPGSNEEEPNGWRSVLEIIDGFAALLGTNRGAVISEFLAKLHLGSHEACDAPGEA
jgi:hypothetical protein